MARSIRDFELKKIIKKTTPKIINPATITATKITTPTVVAETPFFFLSTEDCFVLKSEKELSFNKFGALPTPSMVVEAIEIVTSFGTRNPGEGQHRTCAGPGQRFDMTFGSLKRLCLIEAFIVTDPAQKDSFGISARVLVRGQ